MPDDPMDNLRRLGRRAGGSERAPRPGRADTADTPTPADTPGTADAPAADDGRRSRGSRGAHRHSRRAPQGRLIRRRWPRRLLVIVNVVCLLGVVATAGAFAYTEWRFGQITRIAIPGLDKQGHSSQSQSDGSSIPPFTLLVIGSDTRDLGSGSSAQFGNDQEVQGQRSDSIILVRVVPKTRSLALLSIPRDTLVPIPGYGTTRINTAFNSGTPSLLVSVLNQDFSIQVNHVVEFNFDTFEQVADAVGGVEQWFPAPAKDAYSLLNVPAGCVNLTGAQALAFARSREYEYYLNGQWNYQLYPESDLARIQRQQAFTRDLVHKAKKIAPTDLLELNNIISGITKNLTIDSTLSNSELLSLALDYRSADLTTIPSYTYPTVNSTAVSGALDPETSQGQSVIQQWLDVGQTPASPSSSSSAKSTPPTTDIRPSSISVAVENGSGVGGQASSAGQALSSLGYSVSVSGDAPNFGLATTQVEYAPDSLNDAKQVQSEIEGASQLVADDALTPTPYNVEVVTGQSFGGIKGASAAGSSSATTSTTVGSPAYDGTTTVDPDSSSFYDGVYVPPGLSPGQTPQTCGE